MGMSAQIEVSDRFMLLLAPESNADGAFGKVTRNRALHQDLLENMQRLRGRIYRKDGAIQDSHLTSDGRHALAVDLQSWHLLVINRHGRILGCTRFLQHSNTACFGDLSLRNIPLAQSVVWSSPLSEAIEDEICAARQSGFSYVEIGGWALAEEIRCSTEALRGVLATYAWSRIMGGALGISTATERNGSASILRRLGGRPLDWRGTPIPPYFDSNYGCSMEVLRFDSRSPNPRYEGAINDLVYQLLEVPVVMSEPICQTVMAGETFGQDRNVWSADYVMQAA